VPKRRLYSEIFYRKIVNATLDYAEGDEVPQGWVLYITSACFEDETNLANDMAFGKKLNGDFVPFEVFRQSVLGVRVNTVNTHHLIGGEKPAIRVRGSQLNDVVRGYAEGYYEEV